MAEEDPSVEFPNFKIERDDEGNPVILGRGATGIVYKAFHTHFETYFALKVVRHDQVGYQEAALLSRIHHGNPREANENIVKVHWMGELADGGFWYAMELIDGPTLKTYLEDLRELGSKMDPAEAVRLCLQTARALEFAHRHEAYHRDVKPDNIMLSRNGDDMMSAKLIDFGSLVRGTTDYASPQQLEDRNDDHVRGAWDVYALGSTLWEMLVGYPPFQNPQRSVDKDTVKALKQCDEPPWGLLKEFPEDLQNLLKQTLCEDERLRIDTAADFATRLSHIKLQVREFAFRKVPPLKVKAEDLTGAERLRTSPVCTYYRARHRDHGPFGLLTVRVKKGFDLERLKGIWATLERNPLEHLLHTHLVDLTEGGRTLSIVTEPWSAEDSLRSLLQNRKGKFNPDELKSFGFPVLHALARTADEMQELGLPPPELSSLTITLENSRQELIPPKGRLRIIPWNFGALQQGGDGASARSTGAGDTTVLSTNETLFDAGGCDPAPLSLARLFYEMLGESTSILPTGALRVTGSINQNAFRFLQGICVGNYPAETTCAELFKELEHLYWGGTASHPVNPPKTVDVAKTPAPPEPEPIETPPLEPVEIDLPPEPPRPEPERPKPVIVDAPRLVDIPPGPKPTKPDPGPRTKKPWHAVGIALLLIGGAFYFFKDHPDVVTLLEKLRSGRLIASSDHLADARKYRDGNRHADAIDSYVEAVKAKQSGAEQELSALAGRLAQDPGGTMPPSNFSDTRAGYVATSQAADRAISANAARQETSDLKTVLSQRLQKLDQALTDARSNESSGKRDQALGGLVNAVRSFREFSELMTEAEGVVSRIGRDAKVFTPAQIAPLLAALDDAKTVPVRGADIAAKQLRDELGNRYTLRAQAAVDRARQRQIGDGLDELVVLSGEVKNLPEIATAAADIASIIAASREPFLDFNPFRTGSNYFDPRYGRNPSFTLAQLERAASTLVSPALMRERALLGPENDKQLWLQKASKSGDAPAKLHYAKILIDDDIVNDGITGRGLLKEAWDAKYLAAGPMLAMCLIDGIDRTGATQDLPEAEAILSTVLAADPDNGDAHHAMGRLHEARGNFKDALASYEKAMVLRNTWLRVVHYEHDPNKPPAVARFEPYNAALRIYYSGGNGVTKSESMAQQIACRGAWTGASRCGLVLSIFLADAPDGKAKAVQEESLVWLLFAASLGDPESQATLQDMRRDPDNKHKVLPDLATTLEKYARADKGGAQGGWEYIQALLSFKAGNEVQAQALMNKAAAKGHPFATRWCQRY